MRITSFVALSAIAAIIAHESLGVPLNKKEEGGSDTGMMAGVGIAGLVAGGVAGSVGGYMQGKKAEATAQQGEKEAIIAQKNGEVAAE